MLGVVIAALSLLVLATGSNPVAAQIPPSDELKISLTGGIGLQDTVIPETTGPGTESSALFAPGLGLPQSPPPGALSAALPPGPIPGAMYVILAEPPAEPINPTELPPVTYLGPNGPVVVSDVVVNGVNNQIGLQPFIALVSDNNPDLAFAVAKIPPGAPIVAESGALQDLTVLLGQPNFPGGGLLVVQVRSDVSVPEPLQHCDPARVCRHGSDRLDLAAPPNCVADFKLSKNTRPRQSWRGFLFATQEVV